MGRARRNRAIQRIASSGSTAGRSANGVPGHGLEEVERDLGRVDLAELAEQLEALVDGLAHAEQGAAAQLHAVARGRARRCRSRSVPVVGGDDLREVRLGRLEVVVVAVHAALGEALGLLGGEDAGADTATLRPGLVADDRHQLEEALHGALVGAADGEHDAELAGARARRSPWRRRAPRRCRGTAWPAPAVSNLDDWLQKWQSSGQPPVLADRMPSTSTSGPHHARRTSWARAASDGTDESGTWASVGQLVGGELPALVEQRDLGGPDGRAGLVGGQGRPGGLAAGPGLRDERDRLERVRHGGGAYRRPRMTRKPRRPNRRRPECT